MVNSSEFFGATESSHFFSYATGWLDVDFIDEDGEDLISTDRQSINWETDLTSILRDYLAHCLKAIEKDWRKKRKEKRIEEVQVNTNVNIGDWLGKVPEGIKDQLEGLISKFNDSELNSKDQTDVLKTLHTLIPEYPKYHWRHLNDSIKAVAKVDYENTDYLRAAEEAVKLYEHQVKDKSKLLSDLGTSLMGKAFGPDSEPLKITPNVSETHKNIERGQKQMSMGVISGFRNPAAHEPKSFVYPEIYDDNDCLDLLSMISYLFNKLEKARNIND
jgi:uncharacterized protein (TIGR02391 family)